MGLLGWELCGIQYTKKGDGLFIYKRKLSVNAELNSESEDEITYTETPRLITLEPKPDTDSNTIRYKFGKNGQGITDELLMLGETVKELSKKHRVYLSDPFFDACDDVYILTVTLCDPK